MGLFIDENEGFYFLYFFVYNYFSVAYLDIKTFKYLFVIIALLQSVFSETLSKTCLKLVVIVIRNYMKSNIYKKENDDKQKNFS